jgi:hypothetical protein
MWAWVRIRLLLWQSDFFIVPFLCWNYYPQGDFIASLINLPVPTLNVVDLANAWIYAESHPQEIANAILENEAD